MDQQAEFPEAAGIWFESDDEILMKSPMPVFNAFWFTSVADLVTCRPLVLRNITSFMFPEGKYLQIWASERPAQSLSCELGFRCSRAP
jgi:hypothetical protein